MRDGLRFFPRFLTAVAVFACAHQASAQNTYTYSTTTASNSWLNSANWAGGATNKFPGVDNNPNSTADGNAGDVAAFGVLNTSLSSSIGINFNTGTATGNGNNANANGLLTLGAIDILNTLTKTTLTIGKSDSSTFAANLRLQGTTLGGVGNVIIRNSDDGNFVVAGFVGSGSGTAPLSLQLTNSTLSNVVVNGTGNVTINAVIGETGGARRLGIAGTGTGRVDITASNTFSGGVTITGSEARFSADGSFGTALAGVVNSYIIVDGGRLATASNAVFTLDANRGIQLGDTAGTAVSVVGNSGVLTYNGVLADKPGAAGLLVKQGSGILALGGVSTYTGSTTVETGTLQLTTGNNRLPTGTVMFLGQAGGVSLGTLDLNGQNQEIAGLNSRTGNYSGSFNNTVTSATAATLTVNGGGSYGDGTDANSGVIVGAVSLVKTGADVLTLGDANLYTGTTTIGGGTLRVTNTTGSATGSGVVTVGTIGNTGTLAGTGAVGSTVVTGTGVVSAGSGGAGTLTASAAAFQSGATQAVTITGPNPSNATVLAVTGALNYDADTHFNVTTTGVTFNVNQTYTYTIATYGTATGATSFDRSHISFTNPSLYVSSASITLANSKVTLSFTPAPEPGTVLGVAAAGLGLTGWFRRRRAAAPAVAA